MREDKAETEGTKERALEEAVLEIGWSFYALGVHRDRGARMTVVGSFL